MLPDMMQSDLFSNFTSAEDVISLIYSNVSQTTDKPLEFHPCDIDSRNEHFNCTAEEYLRFYLGPQTLPTIIVLPVTIPYVSVFIAGIVGNVIVCVITMVIIRHSSMHTATNYYLFSLAVSELIYLMFAIDNGDNDVPNETVKRRSSKLSSRLSGLSGPQKSEQNITK